LILGGTRVLNSQMIRKGGGRAVPQANLNSRGASQRNRLKVLRMVGTDLLIFNLL